jgi:hypothetical protein
MKKWAFKKFDGTVPRGDTKIGINKSGLIRLSAMFCRITMVTKFKYCLLYYDGGNRAVALKFTNSKEDGAVTVTKDLKSATLSAKSFFSTNKLDLLSIAGRYDWQKVNVPDIGGVFIIELQNHEATT